MQYLCHLSPGHVVSWAYSFPANDRGAEVEATHASTFQAVGLVMSANMPLSKVSHMAKFRVKEKGNGLLLQWEGQQHDMAKGIDMEEGKLGALMQSTIYPLTKFSCN